MVFENHGLQKSNLKKKKTHWNHGYLTVVFENPINIPSRKKTSYESLSIKNMISIYINTSRKHHTNHYLKKEHDMYVYIYTSKLNINHY